MEGVLGISPGTRSMGLAIFRGSTLVYSQVKSFKGVWSERKLFSILKVVTKVLDKYCVSMVVCKMVSPTHQSDILEELVNNIERVCIQKGVRFSSCYLEDIMGLVLPSGQKASKAMLADMIALKYPDVALEFSREKLNKHPYYIKLFEAIAAWEFHQRKL